jgi:hypothetical protein|tara:strand:- start:125 stop:370 length:246 start_codon:yes stop_codon:yes gene_type:complete
MTAPVKFINDGRYYGLDPKSTVVWKPTIYDVDKFDYDKVKARVEVMKENKNKKGLETMARNFKRVCKDNPGKFDHFLDLLK